jgi:type II secretory pathway pseudopilin PulG
MKTTPIKSFACAKRVGVTLIELLVVLGIVTLLAALILPSVKTILASRKSSQAAIVIKNFMESARARAIGKNRSVAVVLERVSSRPLDRNEDGRIDGTADAPFVSGTSSTFLAANGTSLAPDTNFIPYNACIQMSLAEEPIPLNESMLPFPVSISAHVVGGSIPIPGAPYSGKDSLVDVDQTNGSPEIRVFSVTAGGGVPVADWLAEHLVAGNEISIGDRPTRFRIAAPHSRNPHVAFAGGGSTIWFSVLNEIGLDGLDEHALQPYVDLSNQVSTPVTAFRIFGKPKPVYGQSVQLPKGICIDLSLSGFANNRIGFEDYRVRFASDWVMTGTDGVPTPEALRPIYLIFSPDGSFSRIYANEKLGANYTRIDAVQDVFLHVGKLDQIVMPVDPAVKGRNALAFNKVVAAGIKQNLTDLESYIIRLSPKSTAITAAPIVGLDTQILARGLDPTTLSLGDLIQLSRQGAYGFTATAQ